MSDVKPGYKTSEFGVTVGAVLANILGVLIILGILPKSDADTLSVQVTHAVGAAAVVVANAVAVWKYIESRTRTKTPPSA